MASPKTEARLQAEALCAKYPTHSALGLARKLRKEYPKLYESVEHARDFVRRGFGGKADGCKATSPRPKRKAGELPPVELPDSLAEPWEPFICNGRRVGIISDTHIPYHDKPSIYSAVKTLKSRNIDTLLINGDFADFYQVSAWERNPLRRRFSQELQLCVQSLKWLRTQFPKTEFIYKLGNHEERWEAFILRRAPEIYDVPQCSIESLLELDDLGVQVVKDQRPIMLGKLPVLHGHELKRGIAAPVNPARGAYLKTAHSVLVAHSHRTSSHTEPNMFGKETVVWSIGCLAALNPHYDRFAKSNHGFAAVDVASDGSYDVLNYRIGQDAKVRTA